MVPEGTQAAALGDIKKAMAIGSGFLGVNLERPAALLMPFVSLLRNRTPVDTPQQGSDRVTWRTQFGFGSYDFAVNMGTAENANGGEAGGTATTFEAPYFTQAVHNSVTLQSMKAAEGYDDPLQIAVMTDLATLLRQEELNHLGGNYAAIPAPTGLTAVAVSGSGVTALAYYQVTALTLQGYLANLAGANATLGPLGAGSLLGESVGCAQVAVTNGAGSCAYVTLQWNPVPGAVAYKVYGGTTGAECLIAVSKLGYRNDAGMGAAFVPQVSTQAFVTTTACQQIATGATATPIPTVDGSANSFAGEGIISWMQKHTLYSKAIPAGNYQQSVDCGGLPLTVGSDGITEFDNILMPLWMTWKTSPTFIIGSPKSISSVSGKLMSVGTNNYRIDISAERGHFVGGMFAGGYLNKFVANVLTGMPDVIPLLAHPEMPDGTFLFMSEKIPYQYAREARAWALDVQLPYTYFELARTVPTFPFTTMNIQTLKCYHPSAQGCIVGARV
jgi:hypothetical protein